MLPPPTSMRIKQRPAGPPFSVQSIPLIVFYVSLRNNMLYLFTCDVALQTGEVPQLGKNGLGRKQLAHTLND